MSDDLAELERIAGAILRQIEPAGRRRLLRGMARDLRAAQAARIAAQRNVDGSGYAPRKEKKPPRPGAYAVKFLYPKGSSNPRLVMMKSWVHEGDLLTGYDIEAGGIRSFEWGKVAEWLPVEPKDQNKGAGKMRRKGSLRRQAMFRKLRNGRFLKSGATDRELWVGFSGKASMIASVHQRGGTDRPSPNSKPIRYPQRELIALSVADRTHLLDALLTHVSAG